MAGQRAGQDRAGTWLGTGVIVLPGAVIGRNVVVAAGSVVRGEIGDRCVVAGVPARVVKGFDPETGWTRQARGTWRRADLARSWRATRPGASGGSSLERGSGCLQRSFAGGPLPMVPLVDVTSLADLLLARCRLRAGRSPLLTDRDS